MKNKIFFSITIIFLISLVLAIENTSSNEINSFSTENLNNIFTGEEVDAIVTFKENINETFLENSGAEIKENLESIDTSIITADKKTIEDIQNSPTIELIEPDIDLELFGEGEIINIDKQVVPWGIERVNAPQIWSNTTGKNIKIAVIDSGMNKNHPDLKDNIKGGISFINDTKYGQDDLGHGTSVAGVISALNNEIGIVGVAPESELYSIKIIGASGGKLSNFIQGIQWAIDNDMDIIVMSLGISIDSPALKRIVDEAYSKGIILVAASGKDNQIYYPAKYSSVIAVGSINEDNELTSENGVGEELEFVAPGADVVSTNIEGYSSFDGTSMAAPHVAGVIALLKENNPALSNNEIRAKLQRNAIDLGESGKDNYFGYGLVNAYFKTENLNATIQIIFLEELNNTGFIKVEIIKIENDQERTIQTLFYNSNKKTEDISVESGTYKIKQYFENEIYEGDYNISEGDLIIVPLHKTNPPVHQWIAYQASKIWVTSKINDYITKNNYDDELDTKGYSIDEGILVGTGEEDEDATDDDSCNDGNLGIVLPDKPYCYHFWNPDIPQNGNYNSGWTYSGATSAYDSSYVRAQRLWDNKVIYYYNSGDESKAYYWLGRVAHLLEDAAVPAHMHDDTHAGGVPMGGGDDEYEDFFSDYNNSWSDGKTNYQHFIGSIYQGKQYNFEEIILPSDVKTNPSNLFKLFWYTAQKTQYYASDDVNGDYNYAKETGSLQYPFNPSLWQGESVTIVSNNNNLEDGWGYGNISNLKKESEALIPHAMKAVAGLYRLFWIETHDIEPCNNGYCCDLDLKITKEQGEQPRNYDDYYGCRFNNITFFNFSCQGDASNILVDPVFIKSCDGICQYCSVGSIECANYPLTHIYDSTFTCSSGEGYGKYANGGEHLCQGYCDGVGNRGYARNCTFSVSCASGYTIKPIMNIPSSQQNSIILENKSTLNVSLNKIAKELNVYLDSNLSNNCSQCQTMYSNFTNLNDGKHIINISATDYANNTISNSTSLFIDTKNPIIHETWPSNGTKVLLTTINFGMNYSEENVGAIVFVYKSPNDKEFKGSIIIDEYPQGENQTYFIPINLSQIYNGTSGQLDFFFRIVDMANRAVNSSITTLEIVDCMPNWILEENWSECDINDLKYQDWRDSNECGIEYNKPKRNSDYCDFCIPNWAGTQTCNLDDSLTIWYNDSNSCYSKTNLSSDLDLQGKPDNQTSLFSCDYNKNGIIGNIGLINKNLNNLTTLINSSDNLLREFTGMQDVIFMDDSKKVLEFNFTFTWGSNCTSSNPINFSSSNDNGTSEGGSGGGCAVGGWRALNFYNLGIIKQENTSSYASLIIKGLDLSSQNQTKTVYLDRILNGTGLCIKDSELTSISEISDICTETDEIWIACPGSKNSYSCELINNNTQYKISGLIHSGIKEQATYCGDAVCNGGESCSSCSTDCGVCPIPENSNNGGGGGGGGGGGSPAPKINATSNQTKTIIPNINVPNTTIVNDTTPELNNTNENQPTLFSRIRNFFRFRTAAVIGAGRTEYIFAITFIIIVIVLVFVVRTIRSRKKLEPSIEVIKYSDFEKTNRAKWKWRS